MDCSMEEWDGRGYPTETEVRGTTTPVNGSSEASQVGVIRMFTPAFLFVVEQGIA